MAHLDDHFKGEHSREDVIEITQDLDDGKSRDTESQFFCGRMPSFLSWSQLEIKAAFDKSLEEVWYDPSNW